jgi:hypothetical protein|tara:strand:+ start:561 stop:725 length:165 start_codon:yes stop_codon:yes gene_type:complete
MLLKALIILGGLAIVGAMIYDRFTGKKMARKIIWPLAGGVAAIIIAIIVRGFLR